MGPQFQRNAASPPPRPTPQNGTRPDPSVVIDASNVAYERSLPGCASVCWTRVELVADAWRRTVDVGAVIRVVVDNRTMRNLGPCCKSRSSSIRNREEVDEAPHADKPILRLADESDAAVVTNDLFVDFRREYPWIDGNTQQFFSWRLTPDGIVFVQRNMGYPSDFSKSRGEEASDLKGRGADLSDSFVRNALQRIYRCDNKRCWLHQLSPERYLGLPDLRSRSAALCNGCGGQLADVGQAEQLVQLKLAGDATDAIERLTIAPNAELVIGRETTEPLLQRLLADRAEVISRRHLRIAWNGVNLTVEDLGSKNGSAIRKWNRQTQEYGPPTPIVSKTPLGSRDHLVLAGSLRISRSGHKYFLEASQAVSLLAASVPPTEILELKEP